MAVNQIVFLSSFGIFFLMFFSIPFRVKKIAAKSGEVVFKTSQPSLGRAVIIFLLGFLLMAATMIRSFSLINQLILCGCALLGEEMAMREFCLSGKYGVYEKGIISAGRFVAFDDIVTFPVLNLPPEEQEHYDKRTLVIATKSVGKVELVFASEEECRKVTDEAKKRTGV